jgi:hypothetical protein
MFERGVVCAPQDSHAADVLRALKSSGQKPGLVDRLIHARCAAMPAGMATFEKASRKLAGAVVLP